jgi:hypothetical protein
MRERVRILKPKEFAGETAIVLWHDENTKQVCVRFDRISCTAMFKYSEVEPMGAAEAHV